MWEPQPLTTLRASKACRGENFILQITITNTKFFQRAVFINRPLVIASSNGYSSVCALKSCLNGGSLPTDSFLQAPADNWLCCPNFLPYNSSARPAQTTSFILVCVSVAAGTCLPSIFLAAVVYSCVLRICCLATDVIFLSVSRPVTRNECCFKAVC
jgi:hypothetical protein